MKSLLRSVLVMALVTALAVPAMAGRNDRGANRPDKMNKGPEAREQGPRHPGPGGPPAGGSGRFIEQMLEPKMAEALDLNEAQILALKEGLEQTRAQEKVLIEKLQAAGKNQAEILSAKGAVDEEALMKAIEASGRIRTQMAKLRVQPILLVKKTLTEEQIAAAKKMMRRRMENRREQWSEHQRGGNMDRANGGRPRNPRWQPQGPGMNPMPPEEPMPEEPPMEPMPEE